MLDQIRHFFSGLAHPENDGGKKGFSPDDPRVAAGALMYHVIQADGVLRDVERVRFAEVLRDEYDLESSELKDLVEAAKEADGEAVDLYRFTKVLMDTLDEGQRIKFIELLWEMVYADGYRHELEDNIVWRVSELLGVSGRDRVTMRQSVQTRLGYADNDGDS